MNIKRVFAIITLEVLITTFISEYWVLICLILMMPMSELAIYLDKRITNRNTKH